VETAGFPIVSTYLSDDVTLKSQNTAVFTCTAVRAFSATPYDAVEPSYNSIGLCDTTYIASHILWYRLIPHC